MLGLEEPPRASEPSSTQVPPHPRQLLAAPLHPWCGSSHCWVGGLLLLSYLPTVPGTRVHGLSHESTSAVLWSAQHLHPEAACLVLPARCPFIASACALGGFLQNPPLLKSLSDRETWPGWTYTLWWRHTCWQAPRSSRAKRPALGPVLCPTASCFTRGTVTRWTPRRTSCPSTSA